LGYRRVLYFAKIKTRRLNLLYDIFYATSSIRHLLYDTAIKPKKEKHERMNRTRMINTSTVYLMIVAVLTTPLSTVANGALFASPESDGSSNEEGNSGGSDDRSTVPELDPEQQDPEPVPEPESEPVPKSIPAPLPEPEPESELSIECPDGSTAATAAECPSEPEKEPLPYCDSPEGKTAPACHDRYDYDENTGLYPCNDGSQVPDPLDCTAPAPEPPGPPDDDCLFDTSQPQCVPLPGETDCPEGFGTNEDGRCFPLHERCTSGYHSHEDDESGECIPNSTPCNPGYVMNPDYPSCDKKERVCADNPDADVCKPFELPEECKVYPYPAGCPPRTTVCDPSYPDDETCFHPNDVDIDCDEIKQRDFTVKPPDKHKFDVDGDGTGCESDGSDNGNGNGNRNGNGNSDIDIIIKNINNHVTINKIVKTDPAAFEVDLVAMGINSDGTAMKCMMDVNKAEADCEEFAVPADRVSGTITEFIEHEGGAKDRAQQNSYLNSLKQNINDISFIEDNVDNKDLGVDIAATGINQDGKGMECLINVDKEEAECKEFTVASDKINGEIMEIVEFD
jgi:hypothetical protein